MKRTLTGLILLCLSGFLPQNHAVPADDGAKGPIRLGDRWEELPLPSSTRPSVSFLGIEPGDVPWIMANGSLYYWNGVEFAEPMGDKLKSGQHLTSLYGGGDRPLYATQKGEKNHQGKLYELSDGRVLYFTDFNYETELHRPGLYVSRSGMLFNWGTRFLSYYINDSWERVEARLGDRNTLIFDTGEEVHFYYNGNLFSVDREGRIRNTRIAMPVEDKPGRKRVNGALWGRDRMMLIEYGGNEIFAFNLRTGSPVDVARINDILLEDLILGKKKSTRVYDLFSAHDGHVWLLMHEPGTGYVFRRISPRSEITSMDEVVEFSWDNHRFWQHPQATLNASDGRIWFGLPNEGLARWRPGKVDHMGWREGLRINNCRILLEDSQGDVYAVSEKRVFAYRKDNPQSPPPAWVEEWREYRLHSHPILRDGEGNIWTFLEDRPNDISQWNGKAWIHIPVPFIPSRVQRIMADDRGHILAVMSGSRQGCYEISDWEVRRHETIQDMLLSAVKSGAKRFFTDFKFPGCVVSGTGRIWLGNRGGGSVHYYDGDGWVSLNVGETVTAVLESVAHEALFRTGSGKFYQYDRGQFLELSIAQGESSKRLMGPKGLQPFEAELLEMCRREYTLLIRREDGTYVPPVSVVEPRFATKPSKQSDGLRMAGKSTWPGYHGGFWWYDRGKTLKRVLGEILVACDLDISPLSGAYNRIQMIIEDRNHNLWIVTNERGGKQVYFKRACDISPGIDRVPESTGSSLTFNSQASQDEERLLIWRINDGAWETSDTSDPNTILFRKSGLHEVEVTVMGDLGDLSSQVHRFKVEAEVTFPDTHLIGEGPFISKDILWEMPAEPVPSGPGCAATLAYRIAGGGMATRVFRKQGCAERTRRRHPSRRSRRRGAGSSHGSDTSCVHPGIQSGLRPNRREPNVTNPER